MKFEKIDDLRITDCLDILGIDIFAVKSIVNSYNDFSGFHQSLYENCQNGDDETTKLIINRLSELLYNDKESYSLCNCKADYQNYLSEWEDGLWREEAESAVKRIEESECERKYYESHKNTIAELKTYIDKYPKGKYVNSARQLLDDKLNKRKKLTYSIVAIALIVVAVVCYLNYHSVSYLNSIDDISCGKRGGDISFTISTDAISENIRLIESEDWIGITKDGYNCIVSISPNHDSSKKASITVCAYTTFFGIKLNEKEINFNVDQSSGVASFLAVNDYDIHFNKFSSETCAIYATTDGMNLNISTDGIDDDWIDVDYSIVEDVDNNKAEIRVVSQNNEGGEKEGYIVITSDSFSKRIRISQESGLASRFEVSTTYLTMAEEGTEEGTHYPVRIETDGTTWSVKDSPYWLNAEAKVSSGLLSVTLEPNSGDTRYGTITLVSNNGHIREIEVKQWGDPSDFSASRSTLKFGTSSDYEYVNIDNDSKKSLYVSSDKTWLTVSKQSDSRIRISCTTNNDYPRKGTITVTCGGKSLSITVKQKGWVSCNNCNGTGTISRWVMRNGDFIGYTPMGTAVWGPPYPAIEYISCPRCKDSGKKGYIVKDCD